MAADNRMLGQFNLEGIPPAPRGMPQIEVTFDIDANGILNVSAKDLGTGKEQKITITASSGLSKEEIEKMRKDAESHAEEDKKKLAEIEARNILDNRVYQVEKLLADNREKLSESDTKPVEEAVAAAKSALGGGILSRFNPRRSNSNALRTNSPKCSTRARRRAERRRARRPAKPGRALRERTRGRRRGEVIDAEYVDVDETKKPN